MSISQIKLNFINYLLKYNLIPKELINETEESKNIFAENFEFFKDYLLEQLSTDPEAFFEDFSVIENMDFGETAETEEEGSDLRSQLVEKLLETMYADPMVIELFDKDGDGVLSDKEKANFEALVKGDAAELTVEDLQKAYDAIKAGTFNIETGFTDSTSTDNIFSSGTDGTDSTTPTSPSSGTNPPPSSGGDNPTSTPPTDSTEPEKDYSKMSESDLNTELTNAKSELSTAQSNYQKILSGSDSTLSELKGNIETTYKTYQDKIKEVDETMAGQLDAAVKAVNKQEGLLDAKSLEVSNNKTAFSQAETDHKKAEDNLKSLDASRQALQNTNTSNMTDEQLAQFNKKKAEVEAKYNAAVTAESEAKNKLTEADRTLKTSENEEEKMKTKLKELKDAQSQLEADIAKAHPEVAAAQKEYDDAQAKYDSTKNDMVSAADNAVRTAETKISKIESALNDIKVKEEAKNNQFKLPGEPKTAEELNITAQYIKRGEDSDLPYMLIGPNPPEEGKEYPVLVFCPGMAQYGTGENGMYRDTTPAGVMFDRDSKGNSTYNWDLQGFEGYIIIPQLREGQHWTSDWTSNQVKSILDNLEPHHNITRGKTVLAGASMGAAGVSGIGSRLGSEYFSDYVFISEHPNVKGLDTEHVYGYYAEFGESHVERAMDGKIDQDKTSRVDSFRDSSDKITEKANHSSVVKLLFNHDDNNDGLSDFLAKFFPEYYHS